MKLATIVIGMVLFSIVTTMLFGVIQSISEENNVGKASDWEALSGDYNTFTEKIASKPNSTSRLIDDQTKEGIASSEDQDVRIISGAIGGGRLAINFYANFNEIAQKITGDSSSFIDRRITDGIIAIIGVLIVLMIIYFIRGAKIET